MCANGCICQAILDERLSEVFDAQEPGKLEAHVPAGRKIEQIHYIMPHNCRQRGPTLKDWSAAQFWCLKVATYYRYGWSKSFYLLLRRPMTDNEFWERVDLVSEGNSDYDSYPWHRAPMLDQSEGVEVA